MCEYFGVRGVTRQLFKLVLVLKTVTSDCISFAAGQFRNRATLAAENLFLRKQLAFLSRGRQYRMAGRLGKSILGHPASCRLGRPTV
jgi:hypothetical protein